MTRAGGASWALAAWLLLSGLAGCGDALSSLDSVQNSTRAHYTMALAPDFARRGQVVAFELTLEDELIQRLAGQAGYLTQFQFGDGVDVRSFANHGDGTLSAEVLISPLAREGEREPLLVFAIDGETAEAIGSFWVLPALDSQGDQ